MPTICCGESIFSIDFLSSDATPRDALDAAAGAIFSLFLEREREFDFNPAVVAEYPDIADPGTSRLLTSPLAYIAERCKALNASGAAITRVAILTTYGERLHSSLGAAGYQVTRIEMPAGPDHTYAFVRSQGTSAEAGRTLYLEAVNEADAKIRPSFVARLTDATGRLCGGACGSVHAHGGVRFAYLATMTTAADLPATTGTQFAGVLLDFLRAQNVKTIHLGTQTAGPFYEKVGFKVVHRLVPALRTRQAGDGRRVAHDLVMMAMDL